MSLKGKPITKQVVRLVGVAFGLALALFLFTAVASGHGYHSDRPAHPVSVQIAQHHAGGGFGSCGFNGCGFNGCGFNGCGFGFVPFRSTTAFTHTFDLSINIQIHSSTSFFTSFSGGGFGGCGGFGVCNGFDG